MFAARMAKDSREQLEVLDSVASNHAGKKGGTYSKKKKGNCKSMIDKRKGRLS